MDLDIKSQNQKTEEIKKIGEHLSLITREVKQVIVGNQQTIESIIIAILCNGHILLEGVPGVAKTTMIKAISDSMGLGFKRIQFTPDLLPSDVIGTLIYNPKTQEFETKKGPVFANIVLADEINRAPAKVQSALLEAMQEHQVTLGNKTFKLPKPFFVFATQNPVEQEGTYQLPEAQLDRFMFKINVGYPSKADEKEILNKKNSAIELKPVLDLNLISQAQQLTGSIYTDDKIAEYIVDIINATRYPQNYNLDKIASLISMGASPRASISVYKASKAKALLSGRYFVIPEDVKYVAPLVLRHRIALSYEAQADNIDADYLINQILNSITTP